VLHTLGDHHLEVFLVDMPLVFILLASDILCICAADERILIGSDGLGGLVGVVDCCVLLVVLMLFVALGFTVLCVVGLTLFTTVVCALWPAVGFIFIFCGFDTLATVAMVRLMTSC
jgi:hypothetical protein